VKKQTIRIVAACALIAAIGRGCATYEPKPLDSTAVRQKLDGRMTNDQEIIAVASRLSGTDSGATAAPFDPSDGLTLEEAEVVALVFNPHLRVARLEVGVTRATAETAGLWDDPVTGINLNDVSQKFGGGLSMGGQIALTIPISGRLEAEKLRANAALVADLAGCKRRSGMRGSPFARSGHSGQSHPVVCRSSPQRSRPSCRFAASSSAWSLRAKCRASKHDSFASNRRSRKPSSRDSAPRSLNTRSRSNEFSVWRHGQH